MRGGRTGNDLVMPVLAQSSVASSIANVSNTEWTSELLMLRSEERRIRRLRLSFAVAKLMVKQALCLQLTLNGLSLKHHLPPGSIVGKGSCVAALAT